MKLLIPFLSTVILFLSSYSCSEDVSKADKIDGGIKSIQRWLSIVDSGEYSKSWQATGSLFQKQLSDSQWTDALNKTRKPFGKLISRKIKSSDYKTSLPGVPDGEYIVTVFNTSFENKKKGKETVTAIFENNEWKVVGYFIK
jgi:hypothetical protein